MLRLPTLPCVRLTVGVNRNGIEIPVSETYGDTPTVWEIRQATVNCPGETPETVTYDDLCVLCPSFLWMRHHVWVLIIRPSCRRRRVGWGAHFLRYYCHTSYHSPYLRSPPLSRSPSIRPVCNTAQVETFTRVDWMGHGWCLMGYKAT
jgi:hypothetical protein